MKYKERLQQAVKENERIEELTLDQVQINALTEVAKQKYMVDMDLKLQMCQHMKTYFAERLADTTLDKAERRQFSIWQEFNTNTMAWIYEQLGMSDELNELVEDPYQEAFLVSATSNQMKRLNEEMKASLEEQMDIFVNADKKEVHLLEDKE